MIAAADNWEALAWIVLMSATGVVLWNCLRLLLRLRGRQPSPATCEHQEEAPRVRFQPREGCSCDMCAGIRAHPDLRLQGSTIAAVQAGMILVGTGKAGAYVEQVDSLSKDGVATIYLLVVDGASFERSVRPALMQRMRPRTA